MRIEADFDREEKALRENFKKLNDELEDQRVTFTNKMNEDINRAK